LPWKEKKKRRKMKKVCADESGFHAISV